MNDPKSYDHIETSYVDKGDHIIITTKYRGKNGFGAVVKAWIKVWADLDGNVIRVVGQGP